MAKYIIAGFLLNGATIYASIYTRKHLSISYDQLSTSLQQAISLKPKQLLI